MWPSSARRPTTWPSRVAQTTDRRAVPAIKKPTERAYFGWALAAGDFNSDGFVDLAAAAPLEDVGTVQQAGAVIVLPGSAGGLTASGALLFTQNSPGVPGGAETGDTFGGLEIVF